MSHQVDTVMIEHRTTKEQIAQTALVWIFAPIDFVLEFVRFGVFLVIWPIFRLIGFKLKYTEAK